MMRAVRLARTCRPNNSGGRAVGVAAAAARPMPTVPLTGPASRAKSSTPPKRRAINDEEESLVSTATSYLNALRLRAVSVLTTTLTTEERDEVLKNLNAVDGQAAEEASRRSIGEAVAEAVRREAEAVQSKWAREREMIEARAERAAKERIQHEIALAERRRGMERWQKEVEAEKMQIDQEQQEQKEEEEDGHPILGKPLVDLGYKRVHIVSARSLAAVPIWEKQRVYRHDRARTMAADKMKSMATGLPGIITLHEAVDGQLAILDGQHRVGMMAILEEKIKIGDGGGGGITSKKGKKGSGTRGINGDGDASLFDVDLDRILVEVFPHHDPEATPKHAEDIFTEINKAEPVKLVDMPGVAKGADRKAIDGAAEALKSSFPEMFKPSQRCRAPHLNLDNLRDALFAADVLKRHSIKTDKALVDWMMEKNSELSDRFAQEGANGSRTATKSVSKSALAKAEKFGFFLGLDSSWLYHRAQEM